MKVGIFHWNYENLGGGEVLASNVGKALNEPVFSIVSDKTNKLGFIDITPKLSGIVKNLRRVRTFDYLTWSSVDVTEYGDFDLILSTAPAGRALIVPDNIPHVNLCFSTPRWLYDLYHIRKNNVSFGRQLILPFAEALRIWDSSIDKRVDYYIAISPIIKRRLWKYLKRDSDIIYPPIDVSKYRNEKSENFFLYLSRLEYEKRPEEVINACINSHQELVVVGVGSLIDKLEDKYRNHRNIKFLGFVSDNLKIELLSRCKALIYPPMAEDFGIVPIEALASGKPVICSNDGFPPMLIKDKYGIIIDGTTKGIEKGIKEFDENNYNPENLRRYALQFDFSIFKEKLNERLNFYKKDFDERFNQ